MCRFRLCWSLPHYIGFLIERVAYKPLRSAPRMSIMISAIGVSYTLQNLVLYITGGLNQYYPSIPFISESVTIGTATTKMVTIITPRCSRWCWLSRWSCSSTTPRSAWPCAPCPRTLKPVSSWASRSTA